MGDADTGLAELLSSALVAFTIEVDNEAEHRAAHRTTEGGDARGPWLVSLAMWLNCLQFVSAGEMSIRDVEALAGVRTNWDGLRRWGYITLDGVGSRGPRLQAKPNTRVAPTPAGLAAAEVWRPLIGEVEQRWRKRFGRQVVEDLGEALGDLVQRTEERLPVCLPILGPGLFSPKPLANQAPEHGRGGSDSSASLVSRLSRALVMFALDFERGWPLSLAITANILPALDAEPRRLADLPQSTGVSRAAVDMGVGHLTRLGMLQPVPAAPPHRSKLVGLTPKGIAAQAAGLRRIAEIERRWQDRYGEPVIDTLRERLGRVVVAERAGQACFFDGLRPYPAGWRARSPAPSRLPAYPMVLHRGGYPDGA